MNTKFEIGKTYYTRGGRPVEIIATDAGPLQFPLGGCYKDDETISTWRADGHYYGAAAKSIHDLLLPVEPIKPQLDGQDVTNRYG